MRALIIYLKKLGNDKLLTLTGNKKAFYLWNGNKVSYNDVLVSMETVH